MEDNIESPHGDHVDRTAATRVTAVAATTTPVVMCPLLSHGRAVELGVAETKMPPSAATNQ